MSAILGCYAYPRPTGRGPIEAMRMTSPRIPRYRSIRDRQVAAPLKPLLLLGVALRGLVYPRPTGRGPIEATQPGRGTSLTAFYPRPTGRGPIEARNCGHRARVCESAIRDRQVAAPLKQSWDDVPDDLRRPIRDRQVAAPLKRAVPAPAPSEHGRLSATDRSRPH